MLWRQIASEHEKSRREKAIEMMKFFISENHEEMGLTRQLLTELDYKQSEALFNMFPITLDTKCEELLAFALAKYTGSNVDLNKKDGLIVLSQAQVIALRSIVIRHLNILEAMASAWRHNIADRDILEEEFCAVVFPRKGMLTYQEIITAAGVFPSLREFANELRDKSNMRNNKSKIA